MKKFILINCSNVFVFQAENLKTAQQICEQACIDHSQEIILREYKDFNCSPLQLAQNAICSILTRLNAHNKTTGYTVGIELNMVDETNELTVALSNLNAIIK